MRHSITTDGILVVMLVLIGWLGYKAVAWERQQPPLTRDQVLFVVSEDIARDQGFFLKWADRVSQGQPPRDSVAFIQEVAGVYTSTPGDAQQKSLAVLQSMTRDQLVVVQLILQGEVDAREAQETIRFQSQFKVRRDLLNRLASPTTNTLQSGRVPPP